MSAFVLRIVAMTAMVIDHIGFCFADSLPPVLVFVCRLVGRIAMPIFCFQIAEGLFHTRNVPRYIARLSVFSVCSEIPFDLMISGESFQLSKQNVGFTLLAGLCAILLYDSFAARDRKFLALLSVLTMGLAATLLRADYGLFGVYYVFIFYYFRTKPRYASIALATGVAMQMLDGLFSGGSPDYALLISFTFVAALPIRLYDGRKGRGGRFARLALYSVYPLHMLVMYALTHVL